MQPPPRQQVRADACAVERRERYGRDTLRAL